MEKISLEDQKTALMVGAYLVGVIEDQEITFEVNSWDSSVVDFLLEVLAVTFVTMASEVVSSATLVDSIALTSREVSAIH